MGNGNNKKQDPAESMPDDELEIILKKKKPSEEK